MTINRQWIAREWLYLLAGFVWVFLWPIVIIQLARLVFLVWPKAIPVGPHFMEPNFVAYGPYVIFQIVRITRWAIRTLRETE